MSAFDRAGIREYFRRKGDTPLYPVDPDAIREIVSKADVDIKGLGNIQSGIVIKGEFVDPTGVIPDYVQNIKFRPADFILEKAILSGLDSDGPDSVDENTRTLIDSGGSWGTANAFRAHNLRSVFEIDPASKFNAVLAVPNNLPSHRIALFLSWGAEVYTYPAEYMGFGAVALTIRLENVFKYKGIRFFSPNQFANSDNILSHQLGIAREVHRQFKNDNLEFIVAGEGSGGTYFGMLNYFSSLDGSRPEVRAVGSDKIIHGIIGVTPNFKPKNNSEMEENIIAVADVDARKIANATLEVTGHPIGPSGGAATLAGIRYLASPQHRGGKVLALSADSMRAQELDKVPGLVLTPALLQQADFLKANPYRIPEKNFLEAAARVMQDWDKKEKDGFLVDLIIRKVQRRDISGRKHTP